jgi:hypothetical protein
MTHVRRLSRRGVGWWCVLLCVCATLAGTLAFGVAAAGGASASLPPQANMMLRLRSFAAGAQASLEIAPTAAGGRVRLVATNLPPPNVVAPRARIYLVWATGGRIVRLGELHRDARGNARLEFAHPAPLDRYSLIVTAEESAQADHPGGAPVFSTRANEVSALFPAPAVVRPRNTDTTITHPPEPVTTRTPVATEMRAPASRPVVRARYAAQPVAAAADFYAGIDAALERDAGARDVTLVGVRRAARRARGYARITGAEGTAYVRAHFRRVPSPARFGANRYVLWATTPEGQAHYLGSLPQRGLNRADTYVRAGGVDAEQFDLLVTAERGRRVRGTRRILATIRTQRVYQRPRRVTR